MAERWERELGKLSTLLVPPLTVVSRITTELGDGAVVLLV